MGILQTACSYISPLHCQEPVTDSDESALVGWKALNQGFNYATFGQRNSNMGFDDSRFTLVSLQS
jgi:hypothetical protein